MKSKRAKEFMMLPHIYMWTESQRLDMAKAINLAEQDAEERAVCILEEFIAEGLLLTKEDEILSKFKESLNRE